MEANKNLTTPASYSSATGGGSWLGGWGWLAVCALAIVGAILVFGGSLGSTQEAGKWLLPLLFVLPCAIMMFMCMKNMGGNQGESVSSNAKTGAPRAGTEEGR
jgi:hypothetical protein